MVWHYTERDPLSNTKREVKDGLAPEEDLEEIKE